MALATKTSTINSTSPKKTLPAYNTTISSTNLWHNRLGHISPHRLNLIAKNFLNFSAQFHDVCPVCPLAKQSLLPFSPSVISSTKPFGKIHCDIWGRYRHPSISGA